ncbi:MAG: hypothetical protein P8L64_06475 [Flavobacteriales bacterium]|jgi:hypothetical protein|nr:hypothetical protein [Flavobacteriales bacterium]
MKQSKLIISLGALILFTGCVEVTFSEPMPFNRRDKTHFPNSWLGEWTSAAQGDDLQEHLTINSQYVTFGTDNDALVLGTESVLRKFAGYHILSIKSEDSERWNLLFAKRSKDILHIYEFDGKDKEKAAIWEEILSTNEGGAFEVVKKKDGVQEKVSEYKLNPENNRIFRKLIKKGGLTHMGDYVR